MAYPLGPVKPHVAFAAEEVGSRFKVGTIYGFAQRTYASDHPLGLALDFMVYGDRAKGDNVAAYVQANAARLGVTYIIWYRQIWSAGRASEGWREMENRGSSTANHMDHVHVSFGVNTGNTNVGAPIIPPFINPLHPDNPAPGPSDLVNGPLEVFGRVAALLADPRSALRYVYWVSGVSLLLIALVSAGRGKSVTTTATQIGKVVTNAKS